MYWWLCEYASLSWRGQPMYIGCRSGAPLSRARRASVQARDQLGAQPQEPGGHLLGLAAVVPGQAVAVIGVEAKDHGRRPTGPSARRGRRRDAGPPCRRS